MRDSPRGNFSFEWISLLRFITLCTNGKYDNFTCFDSNGSNKNQLTDQWYCSQWHNKHEDIFCFVAIKFFLFFSSVSFAKHWNSFDFVSLACRLCCQIAYVNNFSYKSRRDTFCSFIWKWKIDRRDIGTHPNAAGDTFSVDLSSIQFGLQQEEDRKKAKKYSRDTQKKEKQTKRFQSD